MFGLHLAQKQSRPQIISHPRARYATLLAMPAKRPLSSRLDPERLRALYVAALPEVRILYPPERVRRITRASTQALKAALRSSPAAGS